jgi:hypothetical protein
MKEGFESSNETSDWQGKEETTIESTKPRDLQQSPDGGHGSSSTQGM